MTAAASSGFGGGEKGFGFGGSSSGRGGGGGGGDDDPWRRKRGGDNNGGPPASARREGDQPSSSSSNATSTANANDESSHEHEQHGADTAAASRPCASGSAAISGSEVSSVAAIDDGSLATPPIVHGFASGRANGASAAAAAARAIDRVARDSVSANPGAYSVVPGRPAERLHSDVTDNASYLTTPANHGGAGTGTGADPDEETGAAGMSGVYAAGTNPAGTAAAAFTSPPSPYGPAVEYLAEATLVESRRSSYADGDDPPPPYPDGIAGSIISGMTSVPPATNGRGRETSQRQAADEADMPRDSRNASDQTGILIVHAKPVRQCGGPRWKGCAAVFALLALTLGLIFGLRQEPSQDMNGDTTELLNGPTEEFCAQGGSPCWRQIGPDLVSSSLGEGLGAMLSLTSDGSRVAVSSIYSLGPPENPGSGLVQVYDIGDDGRLTQVGEDLYGMGADGTLPDHSVARLSGDGMRVALAKLGSDFAGVVRPGTGGEGWFEPGHGEVEVFEYNSEKSVWESVGEALLNGDANVERFGFPVDLSEDGRTVVVGSKTNGAVRGHLFIQEEGDESSAPTLWSSLGSVGESIPEDGAGDSANAPVYWLRISPDGSTLAMASFLKNSVSVYNHTMRQESSEWTKLGEISWRGSSGSSGASVFVSNYEGTTKLGINDPMDDVGGYQSGSVRVFEQWPMVSNASESEGWIQIGQDINGRNILDLQHNVEMTRDGSRIAASSFANVDGYARVFDAVHNDETGKTDWIPVGGDIIGPSGGGYDFGFCVVMSRDDGNRIAVGGPAWGMTRLGIVRLYELV